MNPVEHTVIVDRPREEVFAYLADIANHPEFSDHYLTDWRLLRLDSVGRGAGARFRIQARFNRFSWADLSFVEVDEPHKIIGVGRSGKYNRNKLFMSWILDPAAGGATRVRHTIDMEPALPTDRIAEALGLRRAIERGSARALKRLQRILEEDEDRGARATVAGR